jgi:hypothetical protein
MTVNELIRELSDLNHLDRELEVEGVDYVKVKQDGLRYVAVRDWAQNDPDF